MAEDEVPSDEQYIAAARDIYCDSSDSIEIDDKPALSHADDGCWVAAWVWVYDDAAKEQT